MRPLKSLLSVVEEKVDGKRVLLQSDITPWRFQKFSTANQSLTSQTRPLRKSFFVQLKAFFNHVPRLFHAQKLFDNDFFVF